MKIFADIYNKNSWIIQQTNYFVAFSTSYEANILASPTYLFIFPYEIYKIRNWDGLPYSLPSTKCPYGPTHMTKSSSKSYNNILVQDTID